ncbi:MAG: glycosyltransferase [Anaerolineae bacterium]|nr:glycosyltransferase [Anaerolineae bacterium]
MRVVVLTHVFPRAAADPLGAFLLHLGQALGPRVEMLVVAPHAAGVADKEMVGGICVTRFHYAREADETLAYTGVMHEQVARDTKGKTRFAQFVRAYLHAARRAVTSNKPQVIHAHWWLPGGFVGAVVSKLTGTPLVITTHGTDVAQLERAGWAKTLARFAFGQASAITCGSEYLRKELARQGVADPERIRVIPMPVNPLFAQAQAPESKKKGEEFEILAVARLTRQKNIETLIEAIAILRARGIAARLKIAGDGDQRQSLQEKARAAGLEAFVQFLGLAPQSELPALYAECDVFVLPSVREGMGLVLAEALLCGAPVIATNSGGVTDIVRDGETGLLFPERDANALADALERYAREPHYAARLAQAGRARVMERFTPERVAEQFFQVYERVGAREKA